ncbi:biotin-dependent carboxyltransferase family protein [Micromonospora sp. WMMD1102]|uniref:5-oxoprolinase subunit C family protein n=1 Tax=Micromonospora sp. WMMD1102 TaxID=3016105 RepID=UPI0024153B72|nr:biotin-dependent carboxyltransferase family protein [Micromonospora sp. WMMD1102]MDG4786802.1 biotin-dependent carboxyltransferase family protein [Micromonospora sp. WMMD1102]
MTGGRFVEVVRSGALSTVQDLGRPGHAHLGVPHSGALDLPAHLLANRLVGNPPGAATIETTVTGVAVRFGRAGTVAVTGAWAPVTVDGRPASWSAPVSVPAGARVEVHPARRGLRNYLALAGGIAVPAVLGSRATDLLSGLGPAPLAVGDRLPLGEVSGPPAPVDVAPTGTLVEELTLRVLPGPRADWFTDDAVRILGAECYRVSVHSNRIGVRLDGPALPRRIGGELRSEGVVLGAVQVPAAGSPVVFLADHPTMGGYPVIGVLHPDDLPQVAQAAPGSPVRFQVVEPGRCTGAGLGSRTGEGLGR